MLNFIVAKHLKNEFSLSPDTTIDEIKEASMENPHMKKNEGLRRLIERGREAFHIAENVDYYSEKDYKIAEKKFIKLCIIQQRC